MNTIIAPVLTRVHHSLCKIGVEFYALFPEVKETLIENSAWVDRLQKIVATIEANSEFDTNSSVLRRVKQQRDFLAISQATHSYTPLTSRQLIHGDSHHFNVFFDFNCTVSDVIDRDLVQNIPTGYELPRACIYMFDLDLHNKWSLASLEIY